MLNKLGNKIKREVTKVAETVEKEAAKVAETIQDKVTNLKDQAPHYDYLTIKRQDNQEHHKQQINVLKQMAEKEHPPSQVIHGSVGSVNNQGNIDYSIGEVKGNLTGTLHQQEPKQTLAEAAEEIQKLLKQLEQTNPSATEAQQIEHINDETTPKFKRGVVGALKAAGEAAIDEFILENKWLKVAKAAIKGWIKPE